MKEDSDTGKKEKTENRPTGLQLVFGSGPVGMATAAALLERGLEVRMLSRSGRIRNDFLEGLGAAARKRFSTGKVDALDAGAVKAAAGGATHLYHCANTLYQDWEKTLEPMQDALVEAALAEDAVLALAENLYMYSRGLPKIDEASPKEAPSRKGRLRKRLHEKLERAAAERGLRFTAIRASDFYGPGSTWQSMFGSERFLGPLYAGKSPGLIGNPDQPHSYSYVGDFGRALALAAHDPRSFGRAWILPNDATRTSREVAALFFEKAGRKGGVSAIPRFALRLLGLFDPMIRELVEVLYQKEEPYVVDGSLFAKTFGFVPTSLDEGVAKTLAWYRAGRAAAAS
jgi:nucleoside-diphosphate-sugar epimerase